MKRKKNFNITFLIIIIAVVIIAVVAITVIKNRKTENVIVEEFDSIYEDGTKINTSSELAKTKRLGDLELTEITLSCRNGLSTLLAKVTNKGSVKTEEQKVYVEVLDKDGNVMMELEGLVLPIEPEASTQLNLNVSTDIAGAYDFRISSK